MKISTVFNFWNDDAMLLCLFFIFLIVDLYYLIPAINAQIFNPTAEHQLTKCTDWNTATDSSYKNKSMLKVI